jgi:hypothetical protein
MAPNTPRWQPRRRGGGTERNPETQSRPQEHMARAPKRYAYKVGARKVAGPIDLRAAVADVVAGGADMIASRWKRSSSPRPARCSLGRAGGARRARQRTAAYLSIAVVDAGRGSPVVARPFGKPRCRSSRRSFLWQSGSPTRGDIGRLQRRPSSPSVCDRYLSCGTRSRRSCGSRWSGWGSRWSAAQPPRRATLRAGR